jgi:hypothetical protein
MADDSEQRILEAISEFKRTLHERMDNLQQTMTGGLDDRPGLLERVRVLESSERTRNRTVFAAVIAAASAIGHALWQLLTAKP